MNRPRRVATLVHRYTGLTLALFLTITGLTGAAIAWNDELERVFAPALFVLPPGIAVRPPLDVFALREAAERETGFAVNGVDWTRTPDQPAFVYLEARPGGPAPHDDEAALDPATGRLLATRRHGDLRQGTVNLMPFLYDLHDSLALGETGRLILGLAALLWTIDCFVGAYLTFPARARVARDAPAWLRRWAPAWAVRRQGGSFKMFYDLHRAGGLWPWALMLVIAWSAVSFNLPQVYRPVTAALLGVEPTVADRPEMARAGPPRLDWRAAHARAQAAMARVARQKGFVVRSERLMFLDPDTHVYAYRVLSDRDPGRTGNTQVTIDGDTGALLSASVPTGEAAGTTLTSWIGDIHVADVLGTAMKIALTATGLAAASLSITGVWLWWRKRTSRNRRWSPRVRSSDR